ncbi:APC family permease [Subtercola sp. YIM 133946]|uniref:APC family permease n=1 Tax=Subtercola sp. YIM 133946 TaxID=3118909 RepID=UPI002F95B738
MTMGIAMTLQDPPHRSTTESRSTHGDAALDAGTKTDSEYLGQLGYKQELKRALGLVSSFGIQFSAIAVASALFTTIGVGFGYFGPASFWSFVIGGAFQVFFVGIAIAELVSAYPLSGGVYQIVSRLTKKPWLGWQTGWWIVIAHIVSIPAIAVAIAPAVAGWFGVEFADPGEALPWVLGIIVAGTIVNIVHVRIATAVNNVGVICELVATVIVVVALIAVPHPTQPASILFDTAGTTDGGFILPLLLAFVLPAFIISAFDATGNAGEETKNASRTAPLGQLLANGAGWLFGSIFLFLLMISIPDVRAVMADSFPGKLILESAIGPVLSNIFEVLAIIALFACNCIIQLTGVRVLWSQARDGQLPGSTWLKKVNRWGVPVNATLVCFAIAIIFAVWSSALSVLTAMVALSWALAYTVAVFVGFWALMRKRVPARPFTTGRWWPLVFGVAALWSVVLCTAIVLTDPFAVGGGMVLVIAVGIAIYLLIPKSRRGKIQGITTPTSTVNK